MTDKEKIIDVLLEFYEEYKGNIPNRPMIPSIYASKIIDSLQEEPVSEVWHNASEEPNDMSHCLIFYGCRESVGHYLHYEPVLYNKREKMFITSSFPHPTGYKVEQKSFDGGCVAEVYKDRRDRISISDITQWCYLCDLHKLSNVERTVKNWKEPVSEDLEEACEQLAENARKHKAETSSPFFSQTDYRQGVMDGAKWKNEQMIAKAIDAHCFGFQGAALFTFRLPAGSYLVGSEVKVIVVKED